MSAAQVLAGSPEWTKTAAGCRGSIAFSTPVAAGLSVVLQQLSKPQEG